MGLMGVGVLSGVTDDRDVTDRGWIASCNGAGRLNFHLPWL